MTVSFGEERIFRMRPWRGRGYIDFVVKNGSLLVLPFVTNKNWTHEVLQSKKYQGRRISVTFRAFTQKVSDEKESEQGQSPSLLKKSKVPFN